MSSKGTRAEELEVMMTNMNRYEQHFLMEKLLLHYGKVRTAYKVLFESVQKDKHPEHELEKMERDAINEIKLTREEGKKKLKLTPFAQYYIEKKRRDEGHVKAKSEAVVRSLLKIARAQDEGERSQESLYRRGWRDYLDTECKTLLYKIEYFTLEKSGLKKKYTDAGGSNRRGVLRKQTTKKSKKVLEYEKTYNNNVEVIQREDFKLPYKKLTASVGYQQLLDGEDSFKALVDLDGYSRMKRMREEMDIVPREIATLLEGRAEEDRLLRAHIEACGNLNTLNMSLKRIRLTELCKLRRLDDELLNKKKHLFPGIM